MFIWKLQNNYAKKKPDSIIANVIRRFWDSFVVRIAYF